MQAPWRKRLMGMGAVMALAAVVVFGRGITGRASGGAAEDVGCGAAAPGPETAKVGQQEGELTAYNIYSACYWNKTLGQSCSSNCDCASGICAAETNAGANWSVSHVCATTCSQDSDCPAVNWSGDHLCSNTVDSSGAATPPVCLDYWAYEVWGSRPHYCAPGGKQRYGCITNPTVNNYCYTSGSTTWCQDFYTAKWCSSGGYAYGYDYTGCTWSGWNSQSMYCTGGWEWDGNQTHRHCN